MTLAEDAQKLLDHCDKVGVDLTKTRKRGWDHMGAVIADSALQRRRKYSTTVLPRVRELVAALGGKKSTSDFDRFSKTNNLHDALRWKGEGRIEQMRQTTRVLLEHSVETVADFGKALEDEGTAGTALRADLRSIRGIGPKTMDYFRILVGLDWRAVDTRIKDFAHDARITDRSYDHLAAVLDAAAETRQVTVGALDAAIWEHESSKK